MGRRSFPLVVTALVVVGFAQPVMAAAESSEAAEAVEFRGYFIEDGAPVDFDDMERLVSDFEGQGFGFVALDADPVDGADLYADEVRQASSARTIIVVSAGEIGYVSDDYGTVELNAAAGAAIGTFDTSYVEGFRRFANALAGVPVAAGAAPGSITTPTVAPQAQSEPGGSAATGGGGGFVAFLLIVVAIIGFFFWMSRRNKRKQTA
ncbi:MAG: hypothetical protein OEM97_08000, partial [Acidimicrobiia bacterium]|nr:hypothetical protein [Acidimicrobiia bacterium]